jgi:prolyl-tRNA synthetase
LQPWSAVPVGCDDDPQLEESPGVKFADADLLGMPLRITVSPRTLEKDAVELKRRSEPETSLVPLSEAVGKVGDSGSFTT